METFYDTLGVSQSASSEKIEAVYRDLVKKYHPDTSDSPIAREMLTRVMTARETLKDGGERELYDQIGHEAYIESCIQKGKWPDVTPPPEDSSPNNRSNSTNPITESDPNFSSSTDTSSRSNGRDDSVDHSTTTVSEETIEQTILGDYEGTANQNQGNTGGDQTQSAQSTSRSREDSRDEKKTEAGSVYGGTSNSDETDTTAHKWNSNVDEPFWDSADATIGGDDMGEPKTSPEEPDWSPQASEPSQTADFIAEQPKKYFDKPVILTIYFALNVAAVFSGWSFYAAEATSPSIGGAVVSPIFLGVSGCICGLSIVHYLLRQS